MCIQLRLQTCKIHKSCTMMAPPLKCTKSTHLYVGCSPSNSLECHMQLHFCCKLCQQVQAASWSIRGHTHAVALLLQTLSTGSGIMKHTSVGPLRTLPIRKSADSQIHIANATKRAARSAPLSLQPRLLLQQLPQPLPRGRVAHHRRHASLALADIVLPRDAVQLGRGCQPELVGSVPDFNAAHAPACT
jgi:hypothetical protein